MAAPNPYNFLPDAGVFEVTSTDIADGEMLPMPQVSGVFGAGGDDCSPALSWSGFPAETKSFAVTCFDPDAPTASGFWHWTVYDIPADVTSLPTGAGVPAGDGLPTGAHQLRNDGGVVGYLGAAPPPGHGPHRYMFAVHALDIETLPINPEVSNAVCAFNMFGHVLARAIITPIYQR